MREGEGTGGGDGALDRRRFLGLGALAAGAAAGRVLGGTPTASPACAAIAPPQGGFAGKPYLNVRDFGAKGDGSCWDTQAIAEAVRTALGGKTPGSRLETIFFPPGDYLVGGPIRVDLRGEERVSLKGLKFLGSHARITLGFENCGDAQCDPAYGAFDLIADATSDNHDTEFVFEGLIVDYEHRGDPLFKASRKLKTSLRPDAIRASWVNKVSVVNCRFNRLGNGLRLEHGKNHLVTGCQFEGCGVGVHFLECRDSFAVASVATNCGTGYRFEGRMDHGRDGGNKILGCQAFRCESIGIHLIGQYTPIIGEIVTEACRTANILVESSQFGVMHGIYTGSTSGYALRFARAGHLGKKNEGWTLGNVTCPMHKVKFEQLETSSIQGLVVSHCPESDLGPKAVEFADCHYLEINAIVRALPRSVTHSLAFSGCKGMALHGGVYEKTIRFENDEGQHVFNGMSLANDIEFGPAAESARVTNAGRYYLLKGASPSGPLERREKAVRYGRILPCLADSRTLPAGGGMRWDPRLPPAVGPALLPDPAESPARSVRARFHAVAGSPAGVDGAIIEVLYSAAGFGAAVQAQGPASMLRFSIAGAGGEKGKVGIENLSGGPLDVRFYLLELEYFRLDGRA